MESKSKFYYFVCNVGSESFLKEEIKKFYPQLLFSFSQKGFLTFKTTINIDLKDIVFCNFYGEFVKKGSKEDLILEANKSNLNLVELNADFSPIENVNLKLNQEYLELFPISESEFYLGKFKANNLKRYLAEILPEESPSRAYLKIVEAASKLNIKFNSNETALEIGSSPGGATYALLKQGLKVIGVDPGEMHELCLKFENFKHYKKSIQDFDVKELRGKKIDWLLVDMNLAPEASLNEITKIFECIENDFKGAFITLKMTKISLVSKLPFYVKLIKRMGYQPVLLTQLPSHKQEFLMYVERN